MFLAKREFHKKGVVQRKGKRRRQACPAVRKVWGHPYMWKCHERRTRHDSMYYAASVSLRGESSDPYKLPIDCSCAKIICLDCRGLLHVYIYISKTMCFTEAEKSISLNIESHLSWGNQTFNAKLHLSTPNFNFQHQTSTFNAKLHFQHQTSISNAELQYNMQWMPNIGDHRQHETPYTISVSDSLFWELATDTQLANILCFASMGWLE